MGGKMVPRAGMMDHSDGESRLFEEHRIWLRTLLGDTS